LRQAQQAKVDALTPKQGELEIVEKVLADREREAADCAAVMVKASGAVGRALEEKTKSTRAMMR